VIQFREIGEIPPDVEIHIFSGIVWTIVSWRGFLIVSGPAREHAAGPTVDQIDHQDDPSHAVNHSEPQIPQQSAIRSDVVIFTANEDVEAEMKTLKPSLSSQRSTHMEYFRTVDWASTELGAMNTWLDDLHQMYAFIMADTEAAFLFWGKGLVAIYNAAAVHFILEGSKTYMGSTVERTFPQIWGSFGPIFATVRGTRQVVAMNDIPLLSL
jgi:hypothetical protein